MIPIKTVMKTDVITVRPEMPVFEALELLLTNEISGMPVVDAQNHVLGILSEKDVLEILIDPRLDVKRTVEDYMSPHVTSFSEDGDAIEICQFFIRSNFRRVPIVKDGKLVGIVSRRDIVNVINEAHSKISSFRYV